MSKYKYKPKKVDSKKNHTYHGHDYWKWVNRTNITKNLVTEDNHLL